MYYCHRSYYPDISVLLVLFQYFNSRRKALCYTDAAKGIEVETVNLFTCLR